MNFYVYPQSLPPAPLSKRLFVILVLCLSFVLASLLSENASANQDAWKAAVARGRELGIEKYCWYEICFFVPGKTSGVARPGKPSRIKSPQWQIKTLDTDDSLRRLYVDRDELVSVGFSIRFEPWMIEHLNANKSASSPRRFADTILSANRNAKRVLRELKTPTEEDVPSEDISDYQLEFEPPHIRAISNNVVIIASSDIDSRPNDGRIKEHLDVHAFDNNLVRLYSFTCAHSTNQDRESTLRGQELCSAILDLVIYQPAFLEGLQVYGPGEYHQEQDTRIATRP